MAARHSTRPDLLALHQERENERQRRRRAENPEAVREYQRDYMRQWRTENREKLNAEARHRYAAKHPPKPKVEKPTPPPAPELPANIQTWLAWLTHERGLSPLTIEGYASDLETCALCWNSPMEQWHALTRCTE